MPSPKPTRRRTASIRRFCEMVATGGILFVYGSAPNRGLYDLLLVWPRVKAAIPSAVLKVYYGFSKAVVKWGKQHVPMFDEWRKEVERLLEQDGVILEGMVPHDRLAEAYASAGFIRIPRPTPRRAACRS